MDAPGAWATASLDAFARISYSLDFAADERRRSCARLLEDASRTRRRPNGVARQCLPCERARVAITVHRRAATRRCARIFNAFPAGYWRRWTRVGAPCSFSARVRGRGMLQLMLFRSSGRGLFEPAREVHRRRRCADPRDGRCARNSRWTGLHRRRLLLVRREGRTIGADLTHRGRTRGRVPRSRRAAACRRQTHARSPSPRSTARRTACNQLQAQSPADANVRGRLDTIYCTDQGTDHGAATRPDFAAVAKDLGSTAHLHAASANMGGSGGFARGMYETVKAGKKRLHAAARRRRDKRAGVGHARGAVRRLLRHDRRLWAAACSTSTTAPMLYTLGERFDKAARAYWTHAVRPGSNTTTTYAQPSHCGTPRQLHRRVGFRFQRLVDVPDPHADHARDRLWRNRCSSNSTTWIMDCAPKEHGYHDRLPAGRGCMASGVA